MNTIVETNSLPGFHECSLSDTAVLGSMRAARLLAHICIATSIFFGGWNILQSPYDHKRYSGSSISFPGSTASCVGSK